jgi:integrase
VASAGIRPRGKKHQVYWRLDDGSQGSKTFERKADAKRFRDKLLTDAAAGTFIDPRAGRTLFEEWAREWWRVWSGHPRRSPATLEATENRLRRHVLPRFGQRPLRAVTVLAVRQWQAGLEETLGHESVMACRSILHRIMQAAEDEGLIAANPVRKVPAPKRPLDPDVLLGNAKRRVLTPEEAGRLLAALPAFWRDHFVAILGTGLRVGELAGLRRRRVDLLRRRLEVVDTYYQAGRFGSGFKDRPKSDAGIRVVPLAPAVVEAIARRLPANCGPDELVFTGPGGANRVRRGTRTVLSRDNVRRVYQAAARRAQLGHLDLRGPHDLRHTFATWLEDAAIPARVIDELMGHRASRGGDRGSAVGTRYRHTTTEMQVRVVAAIQDRLAVATSIAAGLLPADSPSGGEDETAAHDRAAELGVRVVGVAGFEPATSAV